LAKPRLEARKDRIVEAARRRRTVMQGLDQALSLATYINGTRDAQGQQWVRDASTKRASEAAELLHAALHGLVMSAPRVLVQDWMNRVTTVVLFLDRVQVEVPPAASWEKFATAKQALLYYNEFLDLPRTRWLERQRAIRAIRSLPMFTESDDAEILQVGGTD
jgi:hypothetical protein